MTYKITLDNITAFYGGYYDCHDFIYMYLDRITAPKGHKQEDGYIALKSYLDATPYPDLKGLITYIKDTFDVDIALHT